MRILHTSDWHLGRIFYGQYLTEDQAYVLESQLIPLLKEACIEALVISGDLYDRAIPPVEAVELWDRVMTKVAVEMNIPILLIGGNHDSGERISCGRKLLARSGVYVAGQLEDGREPVVLQDAYGDISFHLFPFAESKTIANAYGSYQAWIEQSLQADKTKGRRVAVAHDFVAGGIESASERTLLTGGLEHISPSLFSDFTYTALGHLHGPQRIGSETIRYSGSLLKYSFDEHKQHKSFTIVDIDGQGETSLSYVPIEAKHDVMVIEGQFSDLLADIKLQNECQETYLLVRLQDKAPVIDAMARLREVYPRVLSLELTGRMERNELEVGAIDYRQLDERALFQQFAEAVWSEPLSDKEKTYMDTLWQRVVKED